MYSEVGAALAARIADVAPALRAGLLSEELAFDPQPAPCAGISIFSRSPSEAVAYSQNTATTQEETGIRVHLWTETADDLKDYTGLVGRALADYKTAGEGWRLQVRGLEERSLGDDQRMRGVYFEAEIEARGDLYLQRERASELPAMSPTIKVVGAGHGRTTGTVVRGTEGYPTATAASDDVAGIVEAHGSCYFVRVDGQAIRWAHGLDKGVRLYLTAAGVLPLAGIAVGTEARSVALTLDSMSAQVSIREVFEK